MSEMMIHRYQYYLLLGPANAIAEAENAMAEFIVTAKKSDGTALNPSNPITIHYNVADHASQNFLDATEEGDKSTTEAVTFSSDGSGNYIYTISIPIAVNKNQQTDGDITVTLRADTEVPLQLILLILIPIIRVRPRLLKILKWYHLHQPLSLPMKEMC